MVKDELLKEKAALAYNMLILKAANPEILIDSLPKILKQFHALDVNHADYQNYLIKNTEINLTFKYLPLTKHKFKVSVIDEIYLNVILKGREYYLEAKNSLPNFRI